jgi:general secretion pathway protein J
VNARGLTLIEMLLAVTLLAALVALAGTGLATGFDGSERLGRRAAALDDLRTAQGVLRRLITAAQPLASGGGRAVVFAGRADGVDFIAPLPAALGVGLGQFRLQRDEAGRLMLLRKPLGVTADKLDFAQAEASVLLERAGPLRIAYWGPDGNGKSSWRQDWREADALPRLMRVEVAGLAWPELMIAPRLERGDR